MSQTFNIYCDESCHLESDRKKAMVLGAVWLPLEKVRSVSDAIGDLKEKHKLSRHFEAKWTSVSPAKEEFYLELVDYFFNTPELHFRALVVPDKSKLIHKQFNQTHDEWYYKMYYHLLDTLLNVILSPNDKHRIYLDIKDTQGQKKVEKLREVLSNKMYDFDMAIIERMQLIRSHEVAVMQVADLLIGALSALHRGETKSAAKLKLIERIRERSGYSLTKTTLPKEEKMNIFIWQPRTNDATTA